jgi:DNA-binding NtrC family response regulator
MTDSILIVDDETMFAIAIGDYFGRQGYAVNVKFSGEEALQFFEREAADIVVLDFRLPRMDGLEVLRKLKEKGRELEVIMLTAHGTAEGAAEAMQLGAFEYLNKPIDLDELRFVVSRAFQSLRERCEFPAFRAPADK